VSFSSIPVFILASILPILSAILPPFSYFLNFDYDISYLKLVAEISVWNISLRIQKKRKRRKSNSLLLLKSETLM